MVKHAPLPRWQDEAIRNCPVPMSLRRFSYMTRAISLDPDAWTYPLTVEMWPRRRAGLAQAWNEAKMTGLHLGKKQHWLGEIGVTRDFTPPGESEAA